MSSFLELILLRTNGYTPAIISTNQPSYFLDLPYFSYLYANKYCFLLTSHRVTRLVRTITLMSYRLFYQVCLTGFLCVKGGRGLKLPQN